MGEALPSNAAVGSSVSLDVAMRRARLLMQAEHRSLRILLQDVRTRQRYLGDQEIRLGDWKESLRSRESVLDSRAAQGIALESHLVERDVGIQDHHKALNLALTWLPTKESIRRRAREGVQGYV